MNLLYPHTAGSYPIWRASVIQFPLLSLQTTRKKHRPKLLWRWNSRYVGAKLHCSCTAASDENCSGRSHGISDVWKECEGCVEVIVVGSRKDAVLDFCTGSPFLNPVLRFWNIIGYGSEQVRLQQRFTGQDSTPRTVEDFSARESSCKAVILVASAAYGSDHITALEALSNTKSRNGFVVGIILKPFCFEGQRRQDEVKDLVGKLHKQADFCIVLDTDKLLENDLVTLDEALRTSNNAVLMALNAISILLSEKHLKHLSTKDYSTRELQLPDFRKILESYSEARIGFGAGYNLRSSIVQAISECPFLGVDIKDLDGVILCIIASSGVVDCSDANNVLHTVHLVTKCRGDIIVSIVHEPNLEPNTILATIIVFGYTRQQLAPAPRTGILSSLGQHFPFIFNIFKKQQQKTDNSEQPFWSRNPLVSEAINSPVTSNMPTANSLGGTIEGSGVLFGKIQPLLGNTDRECHSSSSGGREAEFSETNNNSSTFASDSEETYIFKRELLSRGNLGPDHLTEMSKCGTNFSETTSLVDSVSVFKLPVGVKNLEKLEDTLSTNTKLRAAWRVEDIEKKQHYAVPSLSWSGLIDADFDNNVNKANGSNNSKKQGVLSIRALSMLESERDSQKKWTRVVEMKYHGGIYRGRAQGGLPEGKGRLLLGDGSIYDGMWHYGKRSGLGTFYFNNGDVFQGSWRDDVMHGKGWIYFHTGDRWFVNFWKGKANGEGRFYSKLGYVFFGHFKEGWRHGHFLRIDVDGTRSQELWDEGVPVSEKQLDPDAEVG